MNEILTERLKQKQIASIIDEAVSCWHEIADTHEIKHCNCFRDLLAKRLIEQGLFIGYDKLDLRDDALNGEGEGK